MDENELTPEERTAFKGLPREAEPSEILEERVVRGLREEGLLRGGGGTSLRRRASGPPGDQDAGGMASLEGGNGRGSAGRRGIRIRPWMLAGSVAASLILFASGVVLGQWMGMESTSQAFLQVREQDAAELALRIQEAGSAYVAALAALGELRQGAQEAGDPEGGDPGIAGIRQGREVALGAMYGAVHELARMAPGDPDVLRVLQILEERKVQEQGLGEAERNVVWF